MKKQMLFALLALTASQVFAYKVTGEAAKSEAPEASYLAPPRKDIQKHTDVGLFGERQRPSAARADRHRWLGQAASSKQ